jgi:hypothetical protein
MVTAILAFIGLLLFAALIVWAIKITWKDPGTGFLNKSKKD